MSCNVHTVYMIRASRLKYKLWDAGIVMKSKLSKVWRPTEHIIGSIGERLMGQDDSTNSIKALKGMTGS